MAQIAVSNLTFAYEGGHGNIFEDVSFQFDTDWKLGFTGRNGRGKTTFLKLLMGEYEYGGTIASPIPFSYFPFDVVQPQRRTSDIAAEIARLDLSAEAWRLCRELNLLQIPEDVLERPFETLSHGERTKTLIACLFLRENRFLLLDEPTNHLDTHGKRIVTKYLQSKKGFIIVSHDRTLLDAVVDHVLSINRTNIEIRRGNFTQWLDEKRRRDRSEADENRKLKQEIGKLQKAARRTSEWSDKVESTKIGCGVPDRGHVGHKAAKMMKRSKSLEARQQNAIEEKSTLLRNVETEGTLKLQPARYHTDTLVQCDALSIAYGARTLFGHFDLAIRQGERIALTGGNGSGKSSLVKLLAGQHIPHTGTLKIGSGLLVSYVSQDTSHLGGDLRRYAASSGVDCSLFMAILHKFGFEHGLMENPIQELSEGQKKKMLIARSLCESAHLYIWDEPLNYIDIQSRIQIEEALVRSEPSILFVEHDETFVQTVATRTVALHPPSD